MTGRTEFATAPKASTSTAPQTLSTLEEKHRAVEIKSSVEEEREYVRKFLARGRPQVIKDRLLTPEGARSFVGDTQSVHNLHTYYKFPCNDPKETLITPNMHGVQNPQNMVPVTVKQGELGKLWKGSEPVLLQPGTYFIDKAYQFDGVVNIAETGYIKHGTLHGVNIKDDEYYCLEDSIMHPGEVKVLGPGFYFFESPTATVEKLDTQGLVWKTINQNAAEKKSDAPRIREGQAKLAGDDSGGGRALFVINPEEKITVLKENGSSVYIEEPGMFFVEPHQKYLDRVSTKLQKVVATTKADTADQINVTGKANVDYQITNGPLALKIFGERNLESRIKTMIEEILTAEINSINLRNKYLSDHESKTESVLPTYTEVMAISIREKLVQKFQQCGVEIKSVSCLSLEIMQKEIEHELVAQKVKLIELKGRKEALMKEIELIPLETQVEEERLNREIRLRQKQAELNDLILAEAVIKAPIFKLSVADAFLLLKEQHRQDNPRPQPVQQPAQPKPESSFTFAKDCFSTFSSTASTSSPSGLSSGPPPAFDQGAKRYGNQF